MSAFGAAVFSSFMALAFALSPQAASAAKHGGGGANGGGGKKTSGNPSFVYSSVTSNSFMRVMDLDGSNDRVFSKTLGSGGGVYGPEPSWAPAGDEIAWVDRSFNKPDGIVVIRLDGNAYPAGDPCASQTLCLLFENTGTLKAGGGNADPVDWGQPQCGGAGPDGTYIAFLGWNSFHADDPDDIDLFLINRDDAATLTAPANVSDTPNEDYEGLAWSPDGQRIATYAFTDDPFWGQSRTIAIFDVCNGSRTNVMLPANHPALQVLALDWAPSGADKLLVTSTEGVWIADFTNSITDPVLAPVISQSGPIDLESHHPVTAVWSPDGTYKTAVSFSRSDGSRAVAIIDLSQGQITDVLTGLSPGRLDWRLVDSP